MTDHGGRADEPTSYGLQPPHAPGGFGVPHPAPQAHIPSPTVPASAPDSAANRLIGGRYRLLARLGHGGMGTVWRAHDEAVDREVAVKEPRVPDHLGEREHHNVHQRMQREARAAARIGHPSVVTVHDVVFEDGRPWIVMELVRGQSLGDRLQEGTLDPREAARIGIAVLDALTAAHAKDVLHRDVKPDNILLGTGDRVVLTDFGIAYVEGEQRLTETGAFVGSPEYISPERVLGRQPGPASDLWSLGVVLYAAVEGMSPFRRSHTPATLQAVLETEPQVLSQQRSGGLGPLVMQLLRKDPAQRPPAAEVRRVLQQIAAPPPPPAPVTSDITRQNVSGPGWRRWLLPPAFHGNRPAQLAVGGGVLVVVLALVLTLVNPFQGDEPPEGWLVRTETEVLSADVAVPSDYKRTEGDDADMVTYADPSGVFEITFWHRVTEAGDESPGADAKARKADYEKGGENTTSMEDAVVKDHALTYQGRAATEMDTEFTPYGATEDDPIRYRFRELLIPREKKTDPYWHVRVEMPADGQAKKDGTAIFDEVKAHFKIRGS
ncbi:serine/threonine-protein kinase [Streptomyces sp. NPDC058375]|uniref:serine/threonine-protein kinase n=1 Tax=Streptomyces sp. NPDC058375 TaxID=3346467 RepID=UPI0036689AB9